MKKFFVILLTVLVSTAVLAGPPSHHHHHHRGPGWGRGYGPPPRYWGYGYRNDGVRLAADIVGLVGAGLYILNPPRPVVVAPQPVVQQVVEQPVIIKNEAESVYVRMPDGTMRLIEIYPKVEKYVPRSTIRYVY